MEKEYYQVVTKDRQHYFSEHSTIDECIDQINYLKGAKDYYADWEYEIIHVVEIRTEIIITTQLS